MKEYFNGLYKSYISSFRLADKRLFLTALFDFLLFCFLAGGFIVWALFFKLISSRLSEAVFILDENNLIEASKTAAGISWMLVISMFALLLFSVASYGFFKSLIWARLLNKKYSWDYFLKFLGLSFLIISPVLIAVILYAGFMQNKALRVLCLVAPFLMHFLWILNYHIANEENSSKKIIRKALGFSIKNIHKYLIPYALMLLAFILMLCFSSLLAKDILKLIFMFAGALLVLSWSRFFAMIATKHFSGN